MSDLRTPLKTLMSRLELVANEHPELFDTQVRESLSEALACVAFSNSAAQVESIGCDFGMYSNDGNQAIRSALMAFLEKAILNVEFRAISSEDRLDHLQSLHVTTMKNLTFDDFF